MRRILSVVIIMSFLLTCSVPCFAENEGNTIENKKVSELIAEGLTKQEAEKVLRYDRIRVQMEENGQKIDVVDGKVVFLNPQNSENCVSKADEEFIAKEYEERLKIKDKLVSTEKRHEDIAKFIKENPKVAKKRITYEDGSWIEVNNFVEYADPISDDKVNVYSIPNETETGSTYYTYDGTYNCISELREYNGAEYCKVYLSQDAIVSDHDTYDVVVYITNVVGGRAYTGIASASDATWGTGTTQTSYYQNPTDWTFAWCKTTFTLTVSSSVSFAGVFSFSISAYASWEEWVSLKCSIVAWHKYVGYLAP